MEYDIILQLVADIRSERAYTGTSKLYEEIGPTLRRHDIKIGRDGLFELIGGLSVSHDEPAGAGRDRGALHGVESGHDRQMFGQIGRRERREGEARRFAHRRRVHDHGVDHAQPRRERRVKFFPRRFAGRREQNEIGVLAQDVGEQSLRLRRIGE